MIVQELVATLGLNVDERAFSRMGQVLRDLGTGLVGFGAAAAAVFVGLGEMARETAMAGVNIEHLSERLGVSTDALQELEYAARLDGISFDQLTDGLRFLARATQEAKEGTEETAIAFRMLKLDPRATTDTEQMLELVAGHFGNLKTQAEKTRVAMALFGRSGANLIPLFKDGAQGIEALKQRARELGIVLDKETIEKSRQFDAQLADLGFSLRGLKFAIGGPLIQAFTKMIKSAADAVLVFQGWIRPKVKEWVDGLSDSSQALADKLNILKAILYTVIGTIAAYALGLAGLQAESVALAWAQLQWGAAALIAGARAAIGWALALAPVILFALALGAVILIWNDVITALKGGDSLTMRLSKQFDSFLKIDEKDSTLVKVLKKVFDLLTGIVHLANPFNMIIDGIQNAKDLFDAVVHGDNNSIKAGFLNELGRAKADLAVVKGFFSDTYRASSAGGGQTSAPSVVGFPFAPNSSHAAQTNHIEIHVPPGSDGAAIGNAVADTLDRHWDGKFAHAYAAADGGG